MLQLGISMPKQINVNRSFQKILTEEKYFQNHALANGTFYIFRITVLISFFLNLFWETKNNVVYSISWADYF